MFLKHLYFEKKQFGHQNRVDRTVRKVIFAKLPEFLVKLQESCILRGQMASTTLKNYSYRVEMLSTRQRRRFGHCPNAAESNTITVSALTKITRILLELLESGCNFTKSFLFRNPSRDIVGIDAEKRFQQ